MECERCRQDFTSAQLRVDARGKRLVCADCITLIKTGMLVPEKVKEEAGKKFSDARKKLALSTAERLDKMGEKKEKYQCNSCDYLFTSIQNFKGKCPYCGEESVKLHHEEAVVKEIDDIF